MRAGAFRRTVALILSWVFTATTVWSATPPAAVGTPPVRVPSRPPVRLLPTPSALAPAGAGAEAREVASAEASEALPALEPAPEPQAGPPGGTVGTAGIFGPQRYVRTTGPKNVYTTAVTVPAWIVSPFTMHIQNGEPDGTYRVSSAWIEVNGTQVAATPNDFNQNVPSLDRSVVLTPQTTLRVTLASNPTSYLSISLVGTSADHTAPVVSIEAPAPGSAGNDTTPRLLVRYRDAAGPGEPAASGVDTSTLNVTLDGVDRTGLFTRRSDEASAELPPDLALAEGPHVLRATVRDRAGNKGEGIAEFRVDLTRPVVAVVEPPRGAYLPTLRPSIRVTYHDDVAVDLASLRIRVNGADRTAEFDRGPGEATAVLDLPAGGNQVVPRSPTGPATRGWAPRSSTSTSSLPVSPSPSRSRTPATAARTSRSSSSTGTTRPSTWAASGPPSTAAHWT